MDKIHLIEIEAWDPSANDGAGGEIMLYYCTGSGFITKPSETPANTVYLPRVKSPGFSRTDIFTKGKTGGSSNMGYGEIVLTNIDGVLDYLVDLGFDGRTLTHRIGPPRKLIQTKLRYGFETESDSENWYCDDGSIVIDGSGVARITIAETSDPPESQYHAFTRYLDIHNPGDIIPGSRYTRVRAKVRVTTEIPGATTWTGQCLFLDDESELGLISADEPADITQWNIVEFDFSNYSGWITENITLLQLRLFSGLGTIYEVEWIDVIEPVGNYPLDYPIQETYTMEQLQIGWSDISILVRDKQFVLDKPLQGTLYAGNNSLPNGLEGVASDLKGKPKILVYGDVYNVSPPQVNTSKLIFQLNDGAINDATVYDRGLALTKGTDYTSESDMTTNAPSAGYYRLYKAGGYVRLGSTPSGLITADIVQGSAASNRTAGQIFNAIALKAGLSAGEISSADITALDTANSAVCGLAFVSETNAREALDLICQTVGAWWTFDESGILRVARLEAPVSDANSPILTMVDLKNNISRDPTGDSDRGVPIWKIILKYRQNYSMQTSDLAGAVTAVRRGELAQEWRKVTAEDSSVQTKHILAPEIEINTAFVSETDAQNEADRQLALRSTRRDRLTVTVLSDKFEDIQLGDTVVVQVPRFGYTSGKDFTVIGRQPDYRLGRVELTLWG